MHSFVSAIRGEIEIRAVVLWKRVPFNIESRDVAIENKDEDSTDDHIHDVDGSLYSADRWSELLRKRLSCGQVRSIKRFEKQRSTENTQLMPGTPETNKNNQEEEIGYQEVDDHIHDMDVDAKIDTNGEISADMDSHYSFGDIRQSDLQVRDGILRDYTEVDKARDVVATIHRTMLHLRDNTTLGQKLKKQNKWHSDCHILLVPPGTQIEEKHLIPIIRECVDHIAIVRGESAVFLKPSQHFDLKIDRHCYLVIPPSVMSQYAGRSPEPLHLVVYVLAVVAVVVILGIIFYRMKKTTPKPYSITMTTF